MIAEPGRYFACSTHVLAVSVISKRCTTTDCDKVHASRHSNTPITHILYVCITMITYIRKHTHTHAHTHTYTHALRHTQSSYHMIFHRNFVYYISDGIYRSFNCLLHGHVKPTPKILQVLLTLLINSPL